MSNKELGKKLLEVSYEEALKEKDPVKRKATVEQIEKLQKLNNEHKRGILEIIVKFVVPILVPILGWIGLMVMRGLMNTETPPDIFYREMAKAILNVFKPKTP